MGALSYVMNFGGVTLKAKEIKVGYVMSLKVFQ